MKTIAKFGILPILLLAFGVRLALHPFGTLYLDINTYIAWSDNLAQGGFASFYNGWSDYLPGYLYVLWLIGHVKETVGSSLLLYKLPAILGDISAGYLIYRIVLDLASKNKKQLAIGASAFFLFNPAIIANSTLWGQVDTLTGLFVLLALYLFNKNIAASALALSIGTLIKPQAAFIAPVLIYMAARNKWTLVNYLTYALVGFCLFIAGFVPFASGRSIVPFVIERLSQTAGQYPYASVNSFNLWGIFGMWQSDMTGGLWSYRNIGYALTIIFSAIAIYKNKDRKASSYLMAAATLLASYLFLTRMHERHLLPSLVPMAVAAAFYPIVRYVYLILSGTYVANLLYAYIWITGDFREIFGSTSIALLVIINIGCLLMITFKSKARLPSFNYHEDKFKPDFNISRNKATKLLAVILILSFTARIISLSRPASEYFDEVYHAFTARQIFKGDPKAWEWWNPSPEGFAYEWTHPPFAKLAMIAGMGIFGENSLGWRMPAAVAGTVSVFVLYMITDSLFKDKVTALLAAGVFALDGLPLVLSRIGMNDAYLLLFVLLSLLMFIKEKHFWGAVSVGLAASSKWSVAWLIPVLLIAHVALRRKFTFKYFWYIFVPPLLYVGSYIPMFATGHDFETFIGMQKQMWWYHTGLEAEHGYTSPWWSWPFMIRPVWLFVEYAGQKIANIYAMGNPFIFWTGVAAFITTVIYAIKEKSMRLGLVVFSYLVFFASWAGSPRIMFLYHYLPSVPFMSILIAATLRRNPKLIKPYLVIAAICFLYFYPHWTGMVVPKELANSYYWFDSWR